MNTRVSATDRAAAKAVQWTAYLIISVAVLFADVMFISLLWNFFPPGILRWGAILGSFTTSASVIGLIVGKSKWFRPGGQIMWAWAFTMVEFAICILNIIVAIQVFRQADLGTLGYYLLIAPGTPIVTALGWAILIFMDPQRAALHARMEMEDDQARSQLTYERAVHDANMEVKQQYLLHTKQFLAAEIQSPQRQAEMRRAASALLAGTLTDVTGKPHYELPAGERNTGPLTVEADKTPNP